MTFDAACAPKTLVMATEAVLSNYRVGSVDWGWDIEFAMLTGQDAHRELTAKMQADIACNGMIEAVLLGTDMRVWDGHHRLCVAWTLEWEWVPVQFAGAAL